MTTYVLDTNVFFGHPEVIAKGSPQNKFVIPDFLYAELTATQRNRERSDLTKTSR